MPPIDPASAYRSLLEAQAELRSHEPGSTPWLDAAAHVTSAWAAIGEIATRTAETVHHEDRAAA